MIYSSLNPSDFWTLPHKQLLSGLLSARPASCRVAPSPTGHIHLGTIRTALHNFMAARASGGAFLLRIDDTDQSRNNQDHLDMITKTLSMLGLDWDTSFQQSDRKAHHINTARLLVDGGWAVRDGSAIRLAPKARQLAPASFFDLSNGVCPISSTFLDQADNLVLIRSDCSPTYHFSSIVDDMDNGVNLIIRGMDHLSNTPKQLIISLALAQAGYGPAQKFCDNVVFSHVGLIMKDGKKLSKRDDASNIQGYLDANIPTQALLQWAFQLGWGHPDPQFDRTHQKLAFGDMPAVFAQGGLRSSNCSMSLDKLKSLAKIWKQRSDPGAAKAI